MEVLNALLHFVEKRFLWRIKKLIGLQMYSLRPATRNQYVLEIDEIRSNVHELILETLKFIDDIYKKGHYTKERWKRVEERLTVFRTYTFAENRLPYFAVDPYCLYSESNAKSPTAEFFTMHQLLSVGKYEKFRKRLNDVYTSLDNFYNQFAEVLLVRINKQDIAGVEKPKLAMFNLYSAAKALAEFQQEYIALVKEKKKKKAMILDITFQKNHF